jgi:hypothetical protein
MHHTCTYKVDIFTKFTKQRLETALYTNFKVPANSLPDYKGNHIYCTDDHHENHILNLLHCKNAIQTYHDIGCFNLEDNKVITYHPTI